MPAGEYNNVPVAVSLLARKGSDRFLLDTVHALYSTLQEEAKLVADRSSSTNNINTDAAEVAKEKVCSPFKVLNWTV